MCYASDFCVQALLLSLFWFSEQCPGHFRCSDAAETILKRFKYTQTPLQTACEAGKALLESSQLCGQELVHVLPGDMPDMRALLVAAQSVKCQMEVCPVHGNTDKPVQ